MYIVKDQINENFLLVLKKDKENKSKVVLNMLMIDSYLNLANEYIDRLSKEVYKVEDLQTLYYFIENNKIEQYINFIKKENISNSYCENLSDRDQAISIAERCQNIINVIESFNNLGTCTAVLDSNSQETIKEFIQSILEEIILVYKIISIHSSYKEAEKDQEVIAFSHRILGWSKTNQKIVEHNTIHKINKNLSFQLDTNFGFGGSCWFYVKLWYKNIQIIPFSEIIVYKYAGWMELKNFSRKYRIENSQWYDAMVFVKEANNILVDDEEKFIKTYIIDELENLLNALNYIISNNEFHILGCNGFEIIKLDGIELLLFRGEKIVNTLDLIESINDFKNITDIEFFIETIVELNKKMKPAMEDGLKVISLDIESLKKEKSEIELIHNKQKDIYNTCVEQVEKLIYRYHFLKKLKWVNVSINLNLIDFKYHLNVLEQKTRMYYFDRNDNKIIDLNYPKYINMQSEYNKIEKKYHDISADLQKYIDYKKELKKYHRKNLDFFEK